MESTAAMAVSFSPEFIFDSFCEWVSDWCQENSVPYEDQVVCTFSMGLTNENFMARFQECCEYLQWG